MKIYFIPLLIAFSLLLTNCDSDPCDTGYTQIKNNDGSSFCLPDYVTGKKQGFEKGNIFYHSKYGVISFKNENWYNEFNIEITELID